MRIQLQIDEMEKLEISNEGLEGYDFVSIIAHSENRACVVEVSLDELRSAVAAFEMQRHSDRERERHLIKTEK